MQASDQHHVGGKRVRNVPIRLEGDGQGNNQRYVNVANPSQPYHANYPQHQVADAMGYEHPQRYQEQRSHHQTSASPQSQSNSPHTSSININYKPEFDQQRQHFSPQTQQQQQYGAWYDQFPKGASSQSPPPPQPQHQQHQQHPQQQQQQQQQQHQHQHQHQHQQQSRQTNSAYDNPNKENSESYVDRNNLPNKSDSAINEQQPCEDAPKKPDPVIPLPPPPEQPKTSKEQQGENNATQDHLDQGKENDKAKQPNGPLSVIQATRAQVNQILQEIIACNETSVKSKDFLRLDELLTVCILKLDDIQAPELRKQRKEVVQLINKCTEILERKVNLNRDIQQLASNCS